MPRTTIALAGTLLAVVALAFSCCLVMGNHGLAMDGLGVTPPHEITGRAMALSLAALIGLLAFGGRVGRLRGREITALAVAAVISATLGLFASYRSAATYWLAGCAHREAYACHDASKAYQYGIGVRRDEARARRYAREACALGASPSCLDVLRNDPAAVPSGACAPAAELCRRDPEANYCAVVVARCPGLRR